MKVVLNLLANDLTQDQLLQVGSHMNSAECDWIIKDGILMIETMNSIEPLKNYLDACRVKYTYAIFTFPNRDKTY